MPTSTTSAGAPPILAGAIECAWFIIHESKFRQRDARLFEVGLGIVDFILWKPGWDREHGGMLYFVDINGEPMRVFWEALKFW